MAEPYRPNLNWEPGGVIPTAGPPSDTVWWMPVNTSTATTTTGTPQYFSYYLPMQQQAQQRLAQQMQEAQIQFQQQQQQWMNFMMDAMRYGQATMHTSWEAKEPEPLETKALTAADRDALDRELPF